MNKKEERERKREEEKKSMFHFFLSSHTYYALGRTSMSYHSFFSHDKLA
jgi:hypothetical protein